MSKAILRSPLHISLVAHSAMTFAFPLSCLKSPVIASHPGIGIGTTRTSLLLNVIGLRTATSAGSMDFCMSFTEALGTFAFYHSTL